jgi:6-pyruvoyltetrahydropterin/6-carboxytetrahydropterin synthase
LNNFIPQPTAENIGLWIHEQLSPHLPGITEIKVFESPTSFATLSF